MRVDNASQPVKDFPISHIGTGSDAAYGCLSPFLQSQGIGALLSQTDRQSV